MRRDRRFSILVTGFLAIALILSAVAWQSNPPRETVILAAPKEASPWPDEYAAQLATVIAFIEGTATRTPAPTAPPHPTPTPPLRCTSGLSSGQACRAATLEPTPTATHAVLPPAYAAADLAGNGDGDAGRRLPNGEE